MVWGMNFPSSFGDFWPEGQFEGTDSDAWWDRLSNYYDAQTPEVQKSLFEFRGGDTYPFFVTQKFKNEIGAPQDGETPLTPIEAHEPPRSFVTAKSYKNLGSLIALNWGLVAVDAELMAVIERLEPQIHQFFPIDIVMPKGVIYPKQYYVFVVGQYFDSFLPDKSKEAWFRFFPHTGNYSYTGNKAGITSLTLSKAIYGSAQIWRERHLLGLPTFFSDEFHGEIANMGIRIPPLYKMKGL